MFCGLWNYQLSPSSKRFYFGLHVFCVKFTVFEFLAVSQFEKRINGINTICIRASLDSGSNSLQEEIWQQMALAWKLCTVIGYSDKQWCTDSHWVLYFIFCCPLCNDWLEELIHLFASCVVWRQNLLLLHILIVLAQLEPFANKMCHFDHACQCFSLSLTVLRTWSLSWLLHQSNQEKL